MSWKKVITSGSNAELNHISASSLRVMPLSTAAGGGTSDRVLVYNTSSNALGAITQSTLSGINTEYASTGNGIDITINLNSEDILSIDPADLNHDLISGSGGTTVFPGSHIAWATASMGTLDPGNYTNTTITASNVGNGLNVLSGLSPQIVTMDPLQGPNLVDGSSTYTEIFTYNDLDTSSAAAGGYGDYQLSPDTYVENDYTSTTGIQTDFSTANILLINKADAGNLDNSTFFNNLVVNDLVTYWVSATRWYEYKITAVDPNNTGANVYHFGLDFKREVITGGEASIGTSPEDHEYFRFLKQADFITGITTVGALTSGNIGTPQNTTTFFPAIPANFDITTTGSISQIDASVFGMNADQITATTVTSSNVTATQVSASVISAPAATVSVSERLAIQGLFTYNNLEFSEAITDTFTGSNNLFGSSLTDSHSFEHNIIISQHLNAAGYTGSGAAITSINPANVNYATLTMGNGILGSNFNFTSASIISPKLDNTGSSDLSNTYSSSNAWDNSYRFVGYTTSSGGSEVPVTTVTFGDALAGGTGTTTIEHNLTNVNEEEENGAYHYFKQGGTGASHYNLNQAGLDAGRTYQLSIDTKLRSVNPDPQLLLNPSGYFSSNTNISKAYVAESEGSTGGFLRLTYNSGSNGLGMLINDTNMTWDATGNTKYRVKLRVKGTKADGVTPQNSRFHKIGNNSGNKVDLSNPLIQPYWQDYEFSEVLGDADYFRFYLQSSTVGDIVDFDIVSVALDASYGVYVEGGYEASTPSSDTEKRRRNDLRNTSYETTTIDFKAKSTKDDPYIYVDYAGDEAYVALRFFDFPGMKVDVKNVTIKEVTSLRLAEDTSSNIMGLEVAPQGVINSHISNSAVENSKILDYTINVAQLTGSIISDLSTGSATTIDDNSIFLSYSTSFPFTTNWKETAPRLRQHIINTISPNYNNNQGDTLSIQVDTTAVNGLALSISGTTTVDPEIKLTGSAVVNNNNWDTGSTAYLLVSQGGTGAGSTSAAGLAASNILSNSAGFTSNALTIGDSGDTIIIPGNLTVESEATTVHTQDFHIVDKFMHLAEGSGGGQTVDSGITFGDHDNSMNTIIFDSGLNNKGRFALKYDFNSTGTDLLGNDGSQTGTNLAMSNNYLLGVFSGSTNGSAVEADQDGNMLINEGEIYFHI